MPPEIAALLQMTEVVVWSNTSKSNDFFTNFYFFKGSEGDPGDPGDQGVAGELVKNPSVKNISYDPCVP